MEEEEDFRRFYKVPTIVLHPQHRHIARTIIPTTLLLHLRRTRGNRLKLARKEEVTPRRVQQIRKTKPRTEPEGKVKLQMNRKENFEVHSQQKISIEDRRKCSMEKVRSVLLVRNTREREQRS
jgi:hypothetical protein